MILLIIAIVLALAGLGWLFLGDETRAAGLLPLVIAAVLFGISCSTIVEAKNVGVVTTFGKPTGTMDPGFNLKKPWDKVTDIDGTVQTREYQGDGCLYVRIGDGSRSCVSLTLRWQIVPAQADQVYADYRADDPTAEVGDKLVSPTLKAALQKNLGDYNPVAQLGAIDATQTTDAALSFAPDYDKIADDTLAGIKQRLGDEPLVDVISLSVSYVSISDNTQSALDAFVKAVGETQQAKQQEQTAQAQAAANQAISASVSNDPNVLVSRCFDLIASGKFAPPVGFSCWPGGDGTLVVPSK